MKSRNEKIIEDLGYKKMRDIYYKLVKEGVAILLSLNSLSYIIDINYLNCCYNDKLEAESIVKNDIYVFKERIKKYEKD